MPYLLLNAILITAALYLFLRKDFLTYYKGGNLWLSWIAIGVITLMDELTSIFYAPSEAYRVIGIAAIIFIPITSLIIRYLTTRMVQIAEILDRHKLKGGGVYNFSYLVLGPVISFVAVGSIFIVYMLTAAISSVSAVENATSFFSLSSSVKLVIEIVLIWLVAGLNIIGIRENTRVTFSIFMITAIILLNLLLGGILNFDAGNIKHVVDSLNYSKGQLLSTGWTGGYAFFIAAISNCILAYSGIESVLQTARLSENWQNIRKAYGFLALSVGIFTPVISLIVLSSSGINFAEHETDLIIHYASRINGYGFGVLIGIVASVTLVMAINTAFVANGELVERVARRYGYFWLVKTNKRAALSRIHVMTAVFFSLIILVTQGGQSSLAEMYAVGLVASFVINLGALLIYNYRKGTEKVSEYSASKIGTFVLFVVILSCFIYLCWRKPHGFALWAGGTAACLLIGVYGTRRRRPEDKEIARGDTPMDVVLYIAEHEGDNIHIHFKRPHDSPQDKIYDVTAFITLFSPRQKIPAKLKENHFRIPFKRVNIFNNIVAIMHLLAYELPDKNITVHFGWPTSSWVDRFSTGIMVFQFMRMPGLFPQINFKIEKFRDHKIAVIKAEKPQKVSVVEK